MSGSNGTRSAEWVTDAKKKRKVTIAFIGSDVTYDYEDYHP